MSPEVIVEAAGPLGDAPSRPIKAFYNLCGYDPSEESPILLSWIGDFFLSGGLPKMATCSESKQFTVCNPNAEQRFFTATAAAENVPSVMVLKKLDFSLLSERRVRSVDDNGKYYISDRRYARSC